ncbi:MAG TPA: hypothetical protein VGI43_08920 [Mucilaginibacter sp.]
MEKYIHFIKKHRFDILVACSVIAFCIDVFFKMHTFSLTIFALYLMGYAADSERSKTNIEERKRLELKGLTKEDLKNIEFVKSWEEIRKKGLIKYSLIDGGIFFGFVLCFVYSILSIIIIKNLMNTISADPSNMLSFIGYTYIAGVISGIIVFRFLWIYNEQKFIRLTDPLH